MLVRRFRVIRARQLGVLVILMPGMPLVGMLRILSARMLTVRMGMLMLMRVLMGMRMAVGHLSMVMRVLMGVAMGMLVVVRVGLFVVRGHPVVSCGGLGIGQPRSLLTRTLVEISRAG